MSVFFLFPLHITSEKGLFEIQIEKKNKGNKVLKRYLIHTTEIECGVPTIRKAGVVVALGIVIKVPIRQYHIYDFNKYLVQ